MKRCLVKDISLIDRLIAGCGILTLFRNGCDQEKYDIVHFGLDLIYIFITRPCLNIGLFSGFNVLYYRKGNLYSTCINNEEMEIIQ